MARRLPGFLSWALLLTLLQGCCHATSDKVNHGPSVHDLLRGRRLMAGQQHRVRQEQHQHQPRQQATASTALVAVPEARLQRQRRTLKQAEALEVLRAGVNTGLFRQCNLNTPGGVKRLAVPANDEYVGASICLQGSWMPQLTDVMLRYVTPGTTVVDAGANFGTYTVMFSQKTGPTGRVVAFEPQRIMFALLTANSVMNGLGNIEVHNAALSFKNGRTSMAQSIPDGASQGQDFEQALQQRLTINYGGRLLGRGTERVRMYMLDVLNLTDVSFMKIDVQGAENLMVWGARDTIMRNKPIINIEDSPFFNQRMTTPENIELMQIPDEVVKFQGIAWLQSIGYVQRERMGEDIFFVHPDKEKERQQQIMRP